MKKSLIVALACSFFAISTTNAQTETYYGAEQGSFALSIGADPVINFVGNMFNGTQDNDLGNLGGTIAGKYFVSEKFALAAELGINNSRETNFTYNPEDEDHKDVIQKDITGSNSFSLGLGAQWYLRPGKRLQPYVGVGVHYKRTNKNYTIEKTFEAEWEEENSWGSTEDFEQEESYLKKSSPINTFAVMANVGVEYFFKPNISISATLDLGFGTQTYKTASKFDTEEKGVDKDYIKERNYSYKTSRDTFFATGLTEGKIAFNFYF